MKNVDVSTETKMVFREGRKEKHAGENKILPPLLKQWPCEGQLVSFSSVERSLLLPVRF